MNKRNDIKKGSPMSKGSIRSGMRNLLVVVLSVVMVTSTIPTEAYADAVKAATTEAAAAATAKTTESSPASNASSASQATTSTQAATQIDLGLALDHTYVTVADQDVALPATKVSAPPNKDLTFAATADEGYDLGTVTYKTADAKTDDDKVELKADENGLYTLPAFVVTTGTELEVTGTQQQTATTEATPAATPLDDAAATSVSTSVASEPIIAVQAASGPVEIDDKIATVSLDLTVNGNPLTDGTTIGRDDTVHAAIDIAYNSNSYPTKDSLDYTYAFPNGVLVNDMAVTTLYDGNGNVAGTYSIEDGKVHFTYSESWIVAHPSNVKTYFQFDFKVDKTATDGQDSVNVKFPGAGTTTTIHFNEGNVSGSKDYKLNDDGTYTFTVNFTPDTTVKDFQFVDTMGENLSFNADSFTLDDNALKVTVDGQKATSEKVATLAAGSHTLTYKAHLSDEALAKIAKGEQLSNTDNKVDWTWGANGKGTTNKTVTFTNTLIDKSAGKLNATTGNIDWHVRLNQATTKVNMAGYVFTDTLTTKGQSYTGSYKVTDVATGKVVYTGTLDSSKDSFTYTFPDGAGEKEYTIEYSTKMDNPSALQTYWNKADVEHNGKHSSDSEKYQNTGVGPDADYVQKDIASNDASGSGVVSWKSTIHVAFIGQTQFEFYDYMGFDENNTTWYNSHVWFADDEKPVVTTAAGVTLVEGEDYTYAAEANWKSDSKNHSAKFHLYFKDSANMREAIKGDIYVTYDTMCDRSAGTYTNFSNVVANGIRKTAKKDYTIDQTPTVAKSNNGASWDASVVNDDGTKGAYVTTWTITTNQSKDNWALGVADLAGQSVTVVDSLPAGVHYIEGTATYDAWTDSDHTKWNNRIDPTVTNATSGDTLSFYAPSSSVLDAIKQADGTSKAVVRISFKTRIDSSVINVGGSTTLENDATASTGSIDFGKTKNTVTVNDKVIGKTSKKNDATGLVDYTVNVNDHAQDLVKNADTLTLTDNLDKSTSLVPTTLKIMSGSTDITSQCTSNVDPDTNVMTIIVPDSAALTVTYSVRTNWTVGETQQVTNTATLEGVENGSSTDDQRYTATNATAGASATAGTITVTKVDSEHVTQTLEGATFALYRVDGWADGDQKIENAKTTLAEVATTDASGTVTFADTTIGAASTSLKSNTLYYYVETVAPEGYKLDSTKHYVMLDDATDGSQSEAFKTALASAQKHGITVNSTTTATVSDEKLSTSAQFSATKTLTGATLEGGKYSFELKDANGTLLQTVTNKADGSVSFDKITYATPGTYTYTISEVLPEGVSAGNPTKDGVTYDTTAREVTVHVRKDGNDLKATTTYDGSTNTPVFTNSYSAKGSASFLATKTLTGATLAAGQFSFALEQTDDNGTVLPDGHKQTVSNGENGAAAVADVKFSDIDYTQADAGKTFYYTISEVIPDGATDAGNGTWTNAGYTYDGHRVSVKVEVTDKGDGTLGITRTYDGSEVAPSFSNGYVASGDVTLTASKKLSGHALEKDQFAFELKDANDGTDNGKVLQTKKNTDQGLVTFDRITYTTPGTYRYTISEKAGDAGKGYTYDAKVSNVTVNVSDNGKGQLEAVASYDVNAEGVGSATAPTFANTYTATGSAELKATKKLTGAKLAADQFEFQVTDSSNTVVATGTNDANGSVTFSAINYTQADAGKTYTYKVSEVAGKTTGMSYDKTIYNATVVVSDNNDGTLSTEVTYAKVDGSALDAGATVPAFANTYKPGPTSVSLKATKTLENATQTADEFNFRVSTDEAGTDVVARGTNAVNGSVTFGDIAINDAGTFTYYISEVTGGVAGVTYDTTVLKATVVVSDHAGTLQVDSVAYSRADGSALDAEATVPVFTNTYSATGTVSLAAKKVLAGDDAKLTKDAFTFKLTSDVEGTKVIQSVSNDADGSVNFSAISYTQADAGKTFTYYISEGVPTGATKGEDGLYHLNGVTYDNTVHTVEVTVTDPGTGELTVTTKYDTTDGAVPTFANTYATSGSVSLEATKTLTGATLGEGQFSFTLQETDEDGKALEGVAPVTVKNDANGKVSFGTITYAKSGTHHYTISEVLPKGVDADNPTKDGVTYDTTAHKVTVTATDGGTGALKVTTDYGTEGNVVPTFANGATTMASLAAKKVMTNPANGEAKVLKAGDYSFTLEQTSAKDSSGVDIATDFKTQTAYNKADGNVDFSAIKYDKAGTYTYRISEVVPADKDKVAGVTYDTTPHTATVTVTDSDGKLAATVAYDGAASDAEVVIPTFTNTYFAASANLSATKYFYGDDQNAKFDFVLTATDDKFNARNDGASASYTASDAIVDDGQAFTATVQNGAFSNKQASVTLPTITYHKAGTYCYTLAEKNTNDAVTSDTAVYQITVVVADDGSVTTSQKIVLDDTVTDIDKMEFYNNTLLSRSFSNVAKLDDVASVSVDPRVYKSLGGRDLTAGEFKFTLKDSAGNTVAKGTNDVSGNVAFTASGTSFDTTQTANMTGILSFSKVGTYTYTINEVTGSDETVNYDAKAITMTVNVTKNTEGKLVANVTYSDDDNDSATAGDTFNNKLKTIDLTVRKTSKDGGEGLEGATYGLWMVNDGGNDVYMGNAVSDSTGLITFKGVKLQENAKYYFKEEAAPEGHLVDPYRSKTFTYVIGDNGQPSLSYGA